MQMMTKESRYLDVDITLWDQNEINRKNIEKVFNNLDIDFFAYNEPIKQKNGSLLLSVHCMKDVIYNVHPAVIDLYTGGDPEECEEIDGFDKEYIKKSIIQEFSKKEDDIEVYFFEY